MYWKLFRENCPIVVFGWLKAHILLAGPYLLSFGFSGLTGLWVYLALMPLSIVAFNYSIGYWPWVDSKESRFVIILGIFATVYVWVALWIMDNALPLISKILP